jgi:hypothetical protein
MKLADQEVKKADKSELSINVTIPYLLLLISRAHQVSISISNKRDSHRDKLRQRHLRAHYFFNLPGEVTKYAISELVSSSTTRSSAWPSVLGLPGENAKHAI